MFVTSNFINCLALDVEGELAAMRIKCIYRLKSICVVTSNSTCFSVPDAAVWTNGGCDPEGIGGLVAATPTHIVPATEWQKPPTSETSVHLGMLPLLPTAWRESQIWLVISRRHKAGD